MKNGACDRYRAMQESRTCSVLSFLVDQESKGQTFLFIIPPMGLVAEIAPCPGLEIS